MSGRLAVVLFALAGCASAGGGSHADLGGGGDSGGAKDGGGAKDSGGGFDFAAPIDFAAPPPDLAASCSDNVKNGMETDVDCGGGACPKCADGKRCLFPTDCQSAMCNNNLCAPAVSCNDNLKNGDETDVDCGGSKCPPCGVGRACKVAADCASMSCSNGLCCGAGTGNCDGNAGNGCEATLASDAKNCGACGNACPMNAPLCMKGMCVAQGMQLVGSYTLGQGANWMTNPPTYTCQEACAAVFGGQAAQYACSTTNAMITHTASIDCWGDFSHCMGANFVAENYKLNATYNCGKVDCACSAFVSDNCVNTVNYCWK